MKIEHRPSVYARLLDTDAINDFTVLNGGRGRVKATMSVPVKDGIAIGWSLFWRSLWWWIRRRRSISFWMEDYE